MSSGIQAFNEGYVKTTWATGDVITAEKLNNIETGIEESFRVFVITITESGNDVISSATFDEIMEALNNGMIPIAQYLTNTLIMTGNGMIDGVAYYRFSNFMQNNGSDQITIESPLTFGSNVILIDELGGVTFEYTGGEITFSD